MRWGESGKPQRLHIRRAVIKNKKTARRRSLYSRPFTARTPPFFLRKQFPDDVEVIFKKFRRVEVIEIMPGGFAGIIARSDRDFRRIVWDFEHKSGRDNAAAGRAIWLVENLVGSKK
jgi:hypothetical protein